jgi:hypothetical protein
MRGRPHTAVAFLTFFVVLMVQVQHCRHFKQLQQVIYSRRGKTVQIDPIKPTLKASGTKRLALNCDDPLSSLGFNFNLRRYTAASPTRSWTTRTLPSTAMISWCGRKAPRSAKL